MVNNHENSYNDQEGNGVDSLKIRGAYVNSSAKLCIECGGCFGGEIIN
jgi:hypothetical protein